MSASSDAYYPYGENGDRVRWYAFHTRARHEKRVNLRLLDRGIAAFLPLVPRQRQWHDRRKIVEWPVFPSYVFARTNRQVMYRVLDTPGVAGVVRMQGKPAPIPDEEIENIQRFVAAFEKAGEVPEPQPLIEEGQRVRVVAGPFAGVEGRVVERRGGGRALVQVGVTAIGQGLRVDVTSSSLEVRA